MADVVVERKRNFDDAGNILTGVNAILVGFDGTIAPKSFVKETLVTSFKECLKPFLEQNFDASDVQSAIDDLRKEVEADLNSGVEGVVVIPDRKEVSQSDVIDAVVSCVLWLSSSGRKTSALKQLQNLVWSSSIRTGKINGSIYKDFAVAAEKLVSDEIKIHIFSSLEIEVQRLLLSFSGHGDLSEFLSRYFDVNSTGAVVEKESYVRIAADIQLNPENIMYISSQTTEITAAHAAGLKTCLIARNNEDESKEDDRNGALVISAFSDLFPENGDIPTKKFCRESAVSEEADDVSNESEENKSSDEAGDLEPGYESPVN